MNFAKWFEHAKAGHHCVIFRDPTYNAKTGGLQTIEMRFRLPTQPGEAPQFEYVSIFRWFNDYAYDVETNWEFDEKGELCSYSQAHFVPPHNPVGRERQGAMAVLRNLYETWKAFQTSYRIEYPEEATSDERKVMQTSRD
ncbi:DUF2787 family protein [Candidatus Sumerlaeota bacterium]|nr:DUF2787 family protein [Candidatus Sumerlaeota bacterium]